MMENASTTRDFLLLKQGTRVVLGQSNPKFFVSKVERMILPKYVPSWHQHEAKRWNLLKVWIFLVWILYE